jgi:hypothetical protein
MFDRSRISEFTIPVSLFVLVLLLFPAAHGSFVATHGPVTALRSLQMAASILLALAALHILLIIRAGATRRLALQIARHRLPRQARSDRDQTCSLLC